jgi:hypothetical protein
LGSLVGGFMPFSSNRSDDGGDKSGA